MLKQEQGGKIVQQLNAKEVKEKISKYLEEKGPSLPIPIGKHLGMNTIFTSAFLSEMASEGTIKISDMKVGGSPLYFTHSKTEMLANFSQYLGGKEREAFELLKANKVLRDDLQNPAIRVALRGLKDFAIPYKQNDKVYWKYFTSNEEIKFEPKEEKEAKPQEIEKAQEETRKLKIEIKAKPETQLIKQQSELEKVQGELDEKRKEIELLKNQIEQNSDKKSKPKKDISKKEKAKTAKKLADEKFLNQIKEILERKAIEILNIEEFDKKQVFAKVKINSQELLLAAYDKRKIADSDLIKAYKKSLALNLPYHILSKGEPSKKTIEAIEAYKKLSNFEKFE